MIEDGAKRDPMLPKKITEGIVVLNLGSILQGKQLILIVKRRQLSLKGLDLFPEEINQAVVPQLYDVIIALMLHKHAASDHRSADLQDACTDLQTSGRRSPYPDPRQDQVWPDGR